MRQELADFSLINITLLPEQPGHKTARVLSKVTTSPVGWFVLASLIVHLAIIIGVAQQHWSTPIQAGNDQHSIKAQLIEIPLARPKAIEQTPNTDSPRAIQNKTPIEIKQIAPEPIKPEPIEPASIPDNRIEPTLPEPRDSVQVLELSPKVDMPQLDFRTKTPVVLQTAPSVNTLLSTSSILPQATQEFLQNQQASDFAKLNSDASAQYQLDLVSPELFRAPEPLTKEALAMKTIMQSKIDIDCASALNQALVIISAFTVGALLCEDKGDVNYFIEQRLAEKRPPPPITGSAQLKALAASSPTSPTK